MKKTLLPLLLVLALCSGLRAQADAGTQSVLLHGAVTSSSGTGQAEQGNSFLTYPFHTFSVLSDQTHDLRTIRLVTGRVKKHQNESEKHNVSFDALKAPQGSFGRFVTCIGAVCYADRVHKENVIISFMHDKDGMK